MKKYMLLLVSSALLVACGSDTKTENTETAIAVETVVQLSDAQLKNMTLQTGKLEKKSISSILKVNGIIDVPPQNMVSISVPLGGFLNQQNCYLECTLQKAKLLQSWKISNTFSCNKII
jgi:cobalt-zinc-cadmium efflux system membrane fusion protein